MNILLAAASLLFGCLLYILFRKGTYVGSVFGGVLFFQRIRKWLQLCACDLLKYYLPDFLWGLALGCGLEAIYLPGIRGTVLCAVVAFAAGVVWELLQYLGAVGGTGDMLDILMYLLASAVTIFINIKEREK